MPSYIFDIETNGIEDWIGLSDLKTIHCIVLKNLETGDVLRFNSQPNRITGIEDGVELLAKADLIIGQNIIHFDIPAIQKFYPTFKPRGLVRDTKVCSNLIWPTDVVTAKDYALVAQKKLPSRLIGKHSLEAWGYRLGDYKGQKPASWAKWTQEMEDYCVQDVEVTAKWWELIVSKKYSETAIQLEHDVAYIIWQQEREGVCFDEEKAGKLYAALVQRRLEVERDCQKVFAPWFMPGALFTPKRDNRKLGYVEGAQCQKVEYTTFNPGSRDHIADRLMKLRGWTPKEFTDKGEPKVDESVLASLPYPEAKVLTKYFLIQKRIGQLAEGEKSYMKFVKDGRIHGEVFTNKAVTGRAAHANPNLGQVPKVKKDKEGNALHDEAGLWGYEFRDLFHAPVGFKMVGVDASGLELRMLGHFMAKWDGGSYAKEVVEGDPHTFAMNAADLETRDLAKHVVYAMLYGAGDGKLGHLIKRGIKAGRGLRSKLLAGIPALKHLIDAVKFKHRTQKFLKGLDGRLIHTRSEHSALNTLLQGAGAIVCKFWMVALHRALEARGWTWGKDYAQVLWTHDEFQFYVRPAIADEFCCIAVETIRRVGKDLGLRVPLDGEGKIGRTWAETH